LQMPSYADGRICCDGADCEKLNKNYPSCTGFTYEPSPDSCAGTVTEPSAPTPCEVDPTSCECNPNQAKCCAAGEVWQDGKCVPEEPVPSGCSDAHMEGELVFTWMGGTTGDGVVSLKCPLTQCASTRTYWHCGADTEYKWEKKEETNCEPKPSETKPCENKGNKIASGNMTAKYTCTSSGWLQSGWDSSACRYSCDASTKPQEDPNKTMKCNYCGEAVIHYECDDTTGNWMEVGGPCSKTQEECGYLCGTAQAECEPGKHDYKSGDQCAPGKGHPGDLVTRYGSNCTFSNGYMCFMKSNQSTDLVNPNPDGGSSNSNVECDCPSAFWSGRYCDERCRWVTERCATSSGGGGGGGGGREGGCSTRMDVVAYYRDALGNYHESWGYVTTCEGER
ncbi:MAG: hypothetical protein Q4P84_03790, partial [Elusimicrobiales bacterium]|nr:hypothetical protein [Elusimicrobiales bacterium]